MVTVAKSRVAGRGRQRPLGCGLSQGGDSGATVIDQCFFLSNPRQQRFIACNNKRSLGQSNSDSVCRISALS